MFAYQPTIETIECECRPCRHCDGEGEITTYVATFGREYYDPCVMCEGTGRDPFDCAVHNPQPEEDPGGAFDPRYGVTAEQLGICEPCSAGAHELPRIGPCRCSCHGSQIEQRRAA